MTLMHFVIVAKCEVYQTNKKQTLSIGLDKNAGLSVLKDTVSCEMHVKIYLSGKNITLVL